MISRTGQAQFGARIIRQAHDGEHRRTSAGCGRGATTSARVAAIGIVMMLILSVSVFLASCPAAVSAAETDSVVSTAVVTAPVVTTPTDAVAIIEDHYRDLTDLMAKVVQRNFLKSVEKTQKFEGSLSIKRPGKLRLEYTNGQVIVIDGKDVWFYSKKSSQAIRRTFKDFEQANIPVAFLLGAGAIRQDFDVTRPEADKPFLLDLVPKKPGAAMKKLRLQTDGSGGISRMIIFDKSGNTSDVVFTEVKEGVGLDDGQFRFKVPKGTEVIEQ